MVEKLHAERDAYAAEAYYNTLQAERLVRVRIEEDASIDHQRILDFVTEVNEASVYRAVHKISEWRVKSKEPITIRFNSPGGDLVSGMALYDYIIMVRNEGITINTVALGMAASMGGILLQAGTRRFIAPGAWLMIHEVTADVFGKLSEIADTTKWVERTQDKLAEILAERSTLTKTQIKNKWRKKDWWLNADEALKLGFVDEIAFTP
jgi:ATP-dependent Clp endopeptidase proteolytic subunit ClpP